MLGSVANPESEHLLHTLMAVLYAAGLDIDNATFLIASFSPCGFTWYIALAFKAVGTVQLGNLRGQIALKSSREGALSVSLVGCGCC